jgi:hypothetical protein
MRPGLATTGRLAGSSARRRARPCGVSMSARRSAITPDRSRTWPWASSMAGFSWPLGPWRSSFMVGFRSEFHCTTAPQWLFVLSGAIEIGLRDGSTRVFGPGQHFYAADTVPPGVPFDPHLHGHWSRQVGDEPLVTAFVRG